MRRAPLPGVEVREAGGGLQARGVVARARRGVLPPPRRPARALAALGHAPSFAASETALVASMLDSLLLLGRY